MLLGTRSAASPCSSNSRSLAGVRRLGLLLATAFVPGALLAQLTTGAIEGTLRATDGRSLAAAPILVTGAAGFRTVIHSNSNGEFAMTLPYGRYRLSLDVKHAAASSGATIFVAPLQTVRFDLVIDASRSIRIVQPLPEKPGIWTDATRARLYPEAFSLQGLLLSREPSSVTAPLDLTGLSDNRLAVESQRGFSWTDTQYKFQGMDATDSYQPGTPRGSSRRPGNSGGRGAKRICSNRFVERWHGDRPLSRRAGRILARRAFNSEHRRRAFFDEPAAPGRSRTGAASGPISLVHARWYGNRRTADQVG